MGECYIGVWAPDNGHVPFPSILTIWGGGTAFPCVPLHFNHCSTPTIFSFWWEEEQLYFSVVWWSIRPLSSLRSQSRKEMWLTGEKYDWLATWSRLEKAKWLTDDLSQYDWRRRRYDDFSQHRRRLQRSPGPIAGFEGCEKERGRKGGERRRKEVKGEEVGEWKGDGRKRERKWKGK